MAQRALGCAAHLYWSRRRGSGRGWPSARQLGPRRSASCREGQLVVSLLRKQGRRGSGSDLHDAGAPAGDILFLGRRAGRDGPLARGGRALCLESRALITPVAAKLLDASLFSAFRAFGIAADCRTLRSRRDTLAVIVGPIGPPHPTARPCSEALMRCSAMHGSLARHHRLGAPNSLPCRRQPTLLHRW